MHIYIYIGQRKQIYMHTISKNPEGKPSKVRTSKANPAKPSTCAWLCCENVPPSAQSPFGVPLFSYLCACPPWAFYPLLSYNIRIQALRATTSSPDACNRAD